MLKIDSRNIQTKTSPYKYCFTTQFVDMLQSADILNWLKEAAWELTVTDFYSQYEFRLDKTNTPNHLHYLFSKETFYTLKKFMQDRFGCQFQDNCYVVAHKLIDGQLIKIHNDYLADEIDIETHRLIIQFNDNWSEDYGGFLMTFNSYNPTDIDQIFLPEHRSMFAFEISQNSYHAVSQIHNSHRYTLIYNFTKVANYEN